MGNSRNLANLLGTGSTIATAKIADDAITSAKIADDAVVAAGVADGAIGTAAVAANAVTSAKLDAGYIKSKQTIKNVGNSATGENDDQDFTPSVEVDMGTPHSATSVFHIVGKTNAAKDQAAQTAIETGGGGSLGIHRKIGTGSWTAIHDYGRWADFHQADIDDNETLTIVYRDYPNTTSQVQYKLVWSTHRAGTTFGRDPTGSLNGDTTLQVTEFDTGETA